MFRRALLSHVVNVKIASRHNVLRLSGVSSRAPLTLLSNRKPSRGKLFDKKASTEGDVVTKELQSASQAFDKLFQDMIELKKDNNPYLQVVKKDYELTIRISSKPEFPPFRVILYSDENKLGFDAPSAPGRLRMYKGAEGNQWHCIEDGHDLHGLLLRDLIPHVVGLPRFSFE